MVYLVLRYVYIPPMVEFYSPSPKRHHRHVTAPGALMGVMNTTHANERVDERCGMTKDELQTVLTEPNRAVFLSTNSKEERSYYLFFDPRMLKCFVAVVAIGGTRPIVITVLEKEMHETDRGMISAEDIRATACSALGTEHFDAWAATFNWAAQRFSRTHLTVRATYATADGTSAQIDVPVSHPVPADVLAGSHLHELATDANFLNRLNVDLCSALGEAAPDAIAGLTRLQVMYGPHVTLVDLLEVGGDQIRVHFQSRRVLRNSVKLFVRFFHDQTPQEKQKTRPFIPATHLFESLLPELGRSDEFLLSVKDVISKMVPDYALLDALNSIEELQITVDGGPTIDLVTADDKTAIDRLMEIA